MWACIAIQYSPGTTAVDSGCRWHASLFAAVAASEISEGLCHTATMEKKKIPCSNQPLSPNIMDSSRNLATILDSHISLPASPNAMRFNFPLFHVTLRILLVLRLRMEPYCRRLYWLKRLRPPAVCEIALTWCTVNRVPIIHFKHMWHYFVLTVTNNLRAHWSVMKYSVSISSVS